MKLFNHVKIKVKDLEKSRKLYGHVMAALGYKMVLEIEGIVCRLWNKRSRYV